MKNTVIILAVFVASIFVSLNANAFNLSGNSQTKFGQYSISKTENTVIIDNVAYKTYNLEYANSKEKFTVLYSPQANGSCCFMVRNDHFEIQYTNIDGRFGVKLVDPKHRTIKKKEVMNQINYNNFVSQLVLTTIDKNEEEYLGLVACFLPLLFS